MKQDSLTLNSLPRSRFSRRLLACMVLAGASGQQAGAFELGFTGKSGIDTNPLTLSDQHDPDGDLFLYGDVSFSADYDKRIFFDAYTRTTLHIDDDRADWSRSKLDLGYKSSFRLGERKIRYELSADRIYRDKTYVSKTTGEEAEFNGESIEDRYDYVTQNYNAVISYRNPQRTKYKLQLQLRDKDYEDFSIPGLSNLDYEHNRLRFSIDYRPSDKTRFVGRIGTTNRDFRDKRADDLNGDDIPGTDLEYDYESFSLDYYYRPSDSFRFSTALDYVSREDNEVGYSDSTLRSLVLSIKYSLSDMETLGASLEYSNYEYDNRNVIDELSLEEDDNDRETYSFVLEYEEILSSEDDHELTRYLSLRITEVDSNDERYAYDRSLISVGIRYLLE